MEHEIVEVGPCPACGAPGDYRYKLRWPGESSNDVVISVSFECPVCGYRVSGERIIVPLKALYLMRNMFVPRLRPVIEKMYLTSRMSLDR
ncbi:MAG: ZPR1-type zinc finger protein [Desulfurococcales archaeon]|nr:ZPR1-type zinc finger protein [Desulfurococcales archaeon]